MGELIELRPRLTERLETHYLDQIRYHGNCQELSQNLLNKLWLKSMGQLALFEVENDQTRT